MTGWSRDLSITPIPLRWTGVVWVFKGRWRPDCSLFSPIAHPGSRRLTTSRKNHLMALRSRWDVTLN